MIALIMISLIGGIAGWFTLPFMNAAPGFVFKKFNLSAKVTDLNYQQAIDLFHKLKNDQQAAGFYAIINA